MSSEPPEHFIRKLRIAEDLAYRLQKPEWRTKGNRDKLQALVKETLEFARSHDMLARLRHMEALEKAQERLETLRDLGSREAQAEAGNSVLQASPGPPGLLTSANAPPAPRMSA